MGAGIQEGQIIGGALQGYGRTIYPNGDWYLGEHLNDDRHGYGKLVHEDGSVQEGFWEFDQLKQGEDSYSHSITIISQKL